MSDLYSEAVRYETRSTTTRQLPSVDGTIKTNAEVDNLQSILDDWSENHTKPDYTPITVLTALSELMESAMDDFMKMNPDPLDDRHPVRTHPQAAYGNLLKTLFRRDEFMSKLIISYFSNRENVEICILSARLLLACVPGLDSEVIFSEPEDFIPRLIEWANSSENETLQAYSMGLLASAMEVQDNASKYRSFNTTLIKVALRRLFELKEKMIASRQESSNTATTTNTPEPGSPGPFSGIDLNEDASRSNDSKQHDGVIYKNIEEDGQVIDNFIGLGGCTQPMRVKSKLVENGISSPPRKKIKPSTSFGSLQDLENSNSCWSKLQPYVIGKNNVYPLTIEMYQRLILQFLSPTGEYQDLLSMALEGNSLDLILFYIDLENTKDVRLTFDALRYLTSLLVHRKFALEFIARGGVQLLLKIPKLCMASVGVITCFYYLSYTDEVMEKVCQLDAELINNVVNYATWCIEHSYESGMASASMFFTHAFYYKAILTRFDQQDGLRLLYNYISTLAVLIDNKAIDRLSDEMIHTSIQAVRNASASFRSYVASHIYVKLEQMKKHCKGLTQFLKIPAESIPAHKAMDMSEETVDLASELLTSLLKISPSGWKPIEHARQLGLLNAMFNILENIQTWANIRKLDGKAEMVRNTLEVIWLCSPLAKVREDFCKVIPKSAAKYNGYRLLTTIAEGNLYEDENVQHFALKTIYNSVQNSHIYKGCFRLDSKRARKTDISEINETEKAVWECLRRNNILMALNSIIRQTTPVTEADLLHDLSCRTFLGLARSEDVRHILAKLPLLANNELQGLMQLPVAQDKKSDHTKFCRSAKELIEIVTQRSINVKIPDPKDLTQERLWKSHVVANTNILYNEKELLQLIHGHLLTKGLTKTASELTKEANLPDVPASCVITPAKIEPLPSLHSYGSTSEPSTSSASLYNNSIIGTPISRTPAGKRLILRAPQTPKLGTNHSSYKKMQPVKGLDGIITDYFRQQHSNCSKPVTVCPPFSLFFPHNCPEPINYGAIPYNIVKRLEERPVRRTIDLKRSLNQDEKYAFSRFRVARNFSEQEECYTCCAFSVDDEHLIVGMFNGDVFWINIETGAEDSHTVCHHSGITHLETANDGSMLLTSSQYMHPLSALWKLRETQEHCYDFPVQRRVKFSNLTQDKIVGTHDSSGKATVYDTESGRIMAMYEFKREFDSSKSRYNTATFSLDDTIILNDGVLWDIRDSTKPIHVFDRLSHFNSEILHPHGNEVIINSTVWDLKNYRLLHTVPALDNCEIKFNSTGNVIYASSFIEEDNYRLYKSSFMTVDSRDYSVITTFDTKRPILDFACSHGDRFAALIERRTQNTDLPFNNEHSNVKILEVGKKRDAEDDLDELEVENDDDGDSHGDDDSLTTGSSNTFDADDIMDVLGFDDGSSSDATLTDEEDDDEGDATDGSDSDSGGWETASEEDNNDLQEENEAEASNSSSSQNSEDEGQEANVESPDNDNAHPSTSSIALNPQIRRAKRRRDSGENS